MGRGRSKVEKLTGRVQKSEETGLWPELFYRWTIGFNHTSTVGSFLIHSQTHSSLPSASTASSIQHPLTPFPSLRRLETTITIVSSHTFQSGPPLSPPSRLSNTTASACESKSTTNHHQLKLTTAYWDEQGTWSQ